MSAAQHTPGPWTVALTAEDDVSWFEVRGSANGDGWMTVVADMIDNQADACLIAAAPNLLEALENLLRLHQSQPRETTSEEIVAEYAIAKARGQQ